MAANAGQHERLLLAALATDSPGLSAVLDELHVSGQELHRATTARLRLAS